MADYKIKTNKKQMVEERSWEEFRDNKMIWFVNSILNVFGWGLAVKMDDADNIEDVVPVRTHYRGYGTLANDDGYLGLTKYMKNHADELLADATDVNEEHYTTPKSEA